MGRTTRRRKGAEGGEDGPPKDGMDQDEGALAAVNDESEKLPADAADLEEGNKGGTSMEEGAMEEQGKRDTTNEAAADADGNGRDDSEIAGEVKEEQDAEADQKQQPRKTSKRQIQLIDAVPPPPPAKKQQQAPEEPEEDTTELQRAADEARRMRGSGDRYNAARWHTLADVAVSNLQQWQGRCARGEAAATESSTNGETFSLSVIEELLLVFPTAARYWGSLVEANLQLLENAVRLADSNKAGAAGDEGPARDGVSGVADASERIKDIFSRCLLSCADVELWCLYIKYIRDTSDSNTTGGIASIREAYEYTLLNIGQDAEAGPIWLAYLTFLKLASPELLFPEKGSGDGSGPTVLQTAAQTAAMREVFKRALLVPSETTTERLWRDYELFENGINKALATERIAEMSPRHLAAKLAFAKRQEVRGSLKSVVHKLAVPPAFGGTWLRDALRMWADVLSFEIANVQRAEADIVIARVRLVYEQGLRSLYLVPAWWLSYGRWLEEQGLDGTAAGVWERATSALPDCLALHFAWADCEEARGNLQAAADIYGKLVTRCNDNMQLDKEDEAGGAQKDALPTGSDGDADADGVGALALVYMTWMRFARRSQGLQAMRNVFKQAHKATERPCPWQVYVTSALLEWDVNKDEKICHNIFELGLKTRLDCANLILAYANFLEQRGDDRNARALFERAIANNTANRVVLQQLWDAFIRFEVPRNTIVVIRRLQKRRDDALGVSTALATTTAAATAAAQKEANDQGPLSSCFDCVMDCERVTVERYSLDMVPDPIPRAYLANCEPVGASFIGSAGAPAAADGLRESAAAVLENGERAGMDAEPGASRQLGTPPRASVPAQTPWPNGDPLARSVRDGLHMLKKLPTNQPPLPLPNLLHSTLMQLKSTSKKAPHAPTPPSSLVMAILLASDTSLKAACSSDSASMIDARAGTPGSRMGAPAGRMGAPGGGNVKRPRRQQPRAKGFDSGPTGGGGTAQNKPPVHANVFLQRQQQRIQPQ